ncbi:MAG: 50S ribosomal protein L17 [bacterium]|nr:50S ribosomal protein L17 [bacterium]
MRHRKGFKKLNRTKSHRKAMLIHLVTSLFKIGRITTTEAKAKGLRKLADKLIILAKREDLHSRRQVLRYIKDKDVVKRLFTTIASRYVERQGGYTKNLKIGRRIGDSAKMVVVELVE